MCYKESLLMLLFSQLELFVRFWLLYKECDVKVNAHKTCFCEMQISSVLVCANGCLSIAFESQERHCSVNLQIEVS